MNFKQIKPPPSRLSHIDISRGIVIILMVLAHLPIPGFLNWWIFSFHMPFFFLISGMLTKWEGLTIREFLKRKTKGLVLPFLIYSLIVWILMSLCKDTSTMELGLNILRKGWGGYALWFIPVLYVSLIVCRCIQGRWVWISALVILCAGAVLCYYKVKLPWTIATIPIATVFLFIGQKVATKTLQTLQQMSNCQLFIVCGLLFIVSALLSRVSRTDLAWNQILPLWNTLLAAMVGTAFVLTFSMWLDHKIKICSRVLAYIGRHTFVVVAFSQIIVILANHYFPTLNVVAKYGLLVLTLWLIMVIETKIKNTYNAYIHNSYSPAK